MARRESASWSSMRTILADSAAPFGAPSQRFVDDGPRF
jgi:hypothetical protein